MYNKAININIYQVDSFRECLGSLTRTYSFFVPRLVSTVVTVKSFMIVTYISLITGLAHLHGTVFAAVTSIRQKADPGWTQGGTLGALTGPFAVSEPLMRVQLCGHKRWVRGVLGTGLYAGENKIQTGTFHNIATMRQQRVWYEIVP